LEQVGPDGSRRYFEQSADVCLDRGDGNAKAPPAKTREICATFDDTQSWHGRQFGSGTVSGRVSGRMGTSSGEPTVLLARPCRTNIWRAPRIGKRRQRARAPGTVSGRHVGRDVPFRGRSPLRADSGGQQPQALDADARHRRCWRRQNRLAQASCRLACRGSPSRPENRSPRNLRPAFSITVARPNWHGRSGHPPGSRTNSGTPLTFEGHVGQKGGGFGASSRIDHDDRTGARPAKKCGITKCHAPPHLVIDEPALRSPRKEW